MKPASILEMLWAEGFTVTLGSGDRLMVAPAGTLNDGQRQMLRDNRASIVAFLREANEIAAALLADLLAAAMRVCDQHGDGPAARADMERDIRGTPPHLRRDLFEHF